MVNQALPPASEAPISTIASNLNLCNFPFYFYICVVDLNRTEIELVDSGDANIIRSKFKAIKIVNGSIIKSHLVCSNCKTCFSILDKNGHKTGQSTLERHLKICKTSKEQPNIETFGTLSKKSN